MDESHPGLRHGLVITFLQIVNGGTPGYSQSLEPGADFHDRLLERMPSQIEVSDLDMIAMMKLLKRASFERGEKFLVIHALSGNHPGSPACRSARTKQQQRLPTGRRERAP